MSSILEINELLCEQLKEKTSFSDVELISGVVMSVICEAFAGGMLYIPTKKSARIHAKLRKKFNGHNHHELAREFDYSVRNVYTILKNKPPEQLEI